MIGAFLRYVLGRRLPLLVGTVVVAVLVIVSARVLPFVWFCCFWSLVLVVALVAAAVFDTGDGADLAEDGRRLASEREDLIARGADPSVLEVPLRPGDGVE